MKNFGHKNEYDFITILNKKKVDELPFTFQELIYYLYPDASSNSFVYCYKNVKEYEKGDICLCIKDEVKYISIKMGKRNSVHCESIEKFVKFLESLNINKKIINQILRFQYADGTLNGSGTYRQSASEYKENNQMSIQIINRALNKKNIVLEAVNRFIIQGTQCHSKKIDLLVYGTPNDFLFVTPEEIYNYMQKKIEATSTTIHFSNLTLQPLSRVLNYNEKLEYMRNWIQIKWYNLEDNIIEIMGERYKQSLE